MARHEFGIIGRELTNEDDFQEYEPEKYGCISIDDDYIEGIMPFFEHIPTYFHRLTWRETGLNYVGITLIPPESCIKFANVLKKLDGVEYSGLIALFEEAYRSKRYVIHYGL